MRGGGQGGEGVRSGQFKKKIPALPKRLEKKNAREATQKKNVE